MSPAGGWALVLGCTLGLGLWSLVALTPRLRRARLIDRVAPYLSDVSEAARERAGRHTVDPLPVLGTLFAPAAARAAAVLGDVLGGSELLARRLRQAGSGRSVVQFRTEQLLAAVLGLAVGLTVTILGSALGTLSPLAQVALPPTAFLVGGALPELVLRRRARARLRRIEAELPLLLEFLSLSLSAGEGLQDALARVSRASSGELAAEFGVVVARVHTGIPLTRALHELAAELRITALARCVDQMIAVLERGTPLAEVLRAQASDARGVAKRELLESGGKKEVLMLVPLIFLILPLTVIFAIFPGVLVLQAGF
ncbi:type II secretion system F family protein [Microterricola viridarii]|uniref:Tight adherence protein C n=1 Tax=Microterricola viridarii TaxID=412690 RepID=A0A1H1S221_9MICO|nr:type II secretion system F family protein [Microterricola viridarii]SDS42045.1 tight adherence protein C [Microterricola viridarii]